MRKYRGERDDLVLLRENLEYIIKYLDEALKILGKDRLSSEDRRKLKKLIKRVMRKAHISLIGLVKNSKGRTILVDHLVIDKKGTTKHYGIHGLRGHNPMEPEQVQFRDKYGKPVEYEEIGEVRSRKRPARKYVKRTRRVKKSK